MLVLIMAIAKTTVAKFAALLNPQDHNLLRLAPKLPHDAVSLFSAIFGDLFENLE